MHVIQVLLPTSTNDGRRVSPALFARVRTELTARFGGVTAYSRAPAEGVWVTDTSRVSRDDLIVVEVMAEELDREWWGDYRDELERLFEQEEVVIRAWSAERI